MKRCLLLLAATLPVVPPAHAGFVARLLDGSGYGWGVSGSGSSP
ncbi:MAG: hypothetical protein ACUVTG_12105 [Candidatus Oleimicrobiaceae bacterium]